MLLLFNSLQHEKIEQQLCLACSWLVLQNFYRRDQEHFYRRKILTLPLICLMNNRRVVDRHGFHRQGRGKIPTDFQNRTKICICNLGLKRTEKIFNMEVSRSKVCQTLPVVAEWMFSVFQLFIYSATSCLCFCIKPFAAFYSYRFL